MKTIGLVGGLGPESTVDYYKEIIGRFRAINSDGSLNYPQIIIYSVNMSVFIGHLKNRRHSDAAAYISEAIENLRKAGADFVAITANTPHLLFPQIQQSTSTPLISIVESACRYAKENKLKKAGLIGTAFTMQSTFFNDVFTKEGIEIVIPTEEEMQFINRKLFDEIELGIYTQDTKEQILQIVNRMKERDGIDSLILGCTEFPIMFPDDQYNEIRFLNTTNIHIDDIVKTCLT